MKQVRVLPEILSNKIAAGEVVERPASVVKELVENSLDAGAKRIYIDIQKGGSDLIRISDDGHGMSREDALLSVQRFATSKIVNDDDLFSIKTFGFRGEALPSMASVSQFTMITRDKDSPAGTRIDINGGKLIDISETGAPVGTMIEVRNLYFNTPARRKFLKTVNTEMGHIADSVSAFALAFPHVYFRLAHNGRNLKHFSESDTTLSRVGTVLGTDSIDDLLLIDSSEIDHSTNRGLYITGYITKPSVTRNSSSNIILFVNKRLISDRAIVSAILRGYKGRLMKGQFPMAVLFIDIPFDQVDVNVHPAKLQVRFANQSLVFGTIVNAVHNALFHGERDQLGNTTHIQYLDDRRDSIVKLSTSSSSDIPAIGHDNYNYNKPLQTIIHSQDVLNFHDIEDNSDQINIEHEKNQNHLTEKRYNQILNQDKTNDKDIFEVNEYSNQNIEKTRYESNYNFQKTKKSSDIRAEMIRGSNITTTLRNLSIIGQFSNTYIIAESNDEMVLIDQHAAHERVVYERLKKRAEGFKPPSQDLIVPEVIEFNHKEAAFIEKILPHLINVGIEIEPFGGTSFAIKSIPAIVNDSSIKPILKDIAGLEEEQILQEGNSNLLLDQTGVWLDNILILMACHSAVRANHNLNLREIEQLLLDLERCDSPFHCPHGRPTIISFSKKEIEKRFKRIVG